MKFPKLVIEEAKNLKKFATTEEINKLDAHTLDADSKFDCVYGKMTGNCFSERAKELIVKSCKKVYATDGYLSDARLNGSPKGKSRNTEGGRTFGAKTSYWSPIEVFIYTAKVKQDKDSPAELIKFLKGEIKTL